MKIYLVVEEPYHDNTTIYGAYTEKKMAEHVSLACFPGSEVKECGLDEYHQAYKCIWWATIRLDTGEETDWKEDGHRTVNELDYWFNLPPVEVVECGSPEVPTFKGIQAFSHTSYEDAVRKAKEHRKSLLIQA